MSVPSLPVRLQPAARRDVRDLLAYTGKQWGTAQKDTYNHHLNNALVLLSQNPELGPAQPQLGIDIRTFRIQRHVIYYRVRPTEVVVIRILHFRMNAADHLR